MVGRYQLRNQNQKPVIGFLHVELLAQRNRCFVGGQSADVGDARVDRDLTPESTVI